MCKLTFDSNIIAKRENFQPTLFLTPDSNIDSPMGMFLDLVGRLQAKEKIGEFDF